jgi:hypothetical protein
MPFFNASTTLFLTLAKTLNPANVASSVIISGTSMTQGSVIYEVTSGTEDIAFWVNGNATGATYYDRDIGSFLPDPDNLPMLQAIKLTAPTVGAASSVSYTGGSNVQDELDDHETRITQNETDISTLQNTYPQIESFYTEDLTVSQTTANTYNTKLTLNINAVAGDYLALFTCEPRDDVGTGLDLNFRLDTNNEIKARSYTPSAIGQWGTWSGSQRFTLTAGSHDFDIRYRASVGGNNIRIRDAKITVVRL